MPVDSKINRLCLLGPIQIVWGGKTIEKLGTQKALALLGYLALKDKPISRDELAGLFWGEMTEEKARNNLRVTLSRLTKILPGILAVDRTNVRFLHNGDEGTSDDVWVDAHEFERLCSRTNSSARVQAASLYRGRLLEGIYLDNCPEFDIWLASEQSRRHLQIVRALKELVDDNTHAGEYELALDYANRLLAFEPWDEVAHRQMMQLLAYSGQRSAALAQYETCRRILDEELGVEPEAETTILYQQIKKAVRQQSSEVLHNLPPQLTPFFGREKETVSLVKRLRNPNYRLVTLVGEGGVGKTRLSLAAAQRAMPRFSNGAWFVPLAGVTSEDGEPQQSLENKIATAIASSVGFSFGGRETPREQVLAHLRQKDLLLLLDNFEQLMAGVDFVSEILQQAPGVTLLVTSRERFNLQAEYAMRVEGLPVPDCSPSPGDPYACLEECPSVQLFAERADRTLDGFDLQVENLPRVIETCRLLEGHPLGIELAAAWVEQLALGEIIENIQTNLDFLETRMRDMPDRHRSIRAVFLGSWGLLTSTEQASLACFSVFRGGFTLNAVVAVIGEMLLELIIEESSGSDEFEGTLQIADHCLRIIEKLIDKSLLRPTESGRYEFHELLRQFAAEKLDEKPEQAAQVQARYGQFYADFLAQRKEKLKGFEQADAVQEIQSEMDNISVAWTWSAVQGLVGNIEVALDSLFIFYMINSRFQEGGAAFGDAIAHLKKSTTWEDEDLNSRLVGRLLARQGAFYQRLGLYPENRDLAQESLVIARHWNDESEMAFSLTALAFIADDLGNHMESRRLKEDVLALHKKIGNKTSVAVSLNNLGVGASLNGDYAAARDYYQESLAIAMEDGDTESIAIALSNHGAAVMALGEYSAAKKRYQESLSLREEIGDRHGIGLVKSFLGQCAYFEGDYQTAMDLLDQGLEILRETRSPKDINAALVSLGDVSMSQRNFPAAQEFFQEALLIAEEHNHHLGIARALCGLGRAALAYGDEQDVHAYLVQGVQKAAEMGAQAVVASGLLDYAKLLSNKDEYERAAEFLSFIAHFPFGRQYTRNDAQKTLSDLLPDLPVEIATAAQARGQSLTLEEVIAGIPQTS